MNISQFARSRAQIDPWGRSTEAVETYQKAKAELDASAKNDWENPEFHRQVASDVASILDYQFTFENLFGT